MQEDLLELIKLLNQMSPEQLQDFVTAAQELVKLLSVPGFAQELKALLSDQDSQHTTE